MAATVRARGNERGANERHQGGQQMNTSDTAPRVRAFIFTQRCTPAYRHRQAGRHVDDATPDT